MGIYINVEIITIVYVFENGRSQFFAIDYLLSTKLLIYINYNKILDLKIERNLIIKRKSIILKLFDRNFDLKIKRKF